MVNFYQKTKKGGILMDTIAMPGHVYYSLPLIERHMLFARHRLVFHKMDYGRLIWIQFKKEVGHEGSPCISGYDDASTQGSVS